MNPSTRRVALYAIGAIAILASINALTHSYAGLYDWAVHHRLTGWQAMSWPAEIDVFLAVGELALYVAYLDGWPVSQRIWPWATALIGLGVSVAGNIGHIQAEPGHPVILADRLTAATSPLAAFAGLAIGLLVLKMTRQRSRGDSAQFRAGRNSPALVATISQQRPSGVSRRNAAEPAAASNGDSPPDNGTGRGRLGQHRLLHDARLIYQTASASGERLSQRTLARQLRVHGHRFSNEHLRGIAASIGLTADKAA
jgi:hypothetical protein